MKKSLLIALIAFVGYSIYAQVYNPVTYNYNGTPTYGVKIKTNIPYTSSTQMPTIIIEGYNYGAASIIDLTLAYYIYDGSFINYTISSNGGYTPIVTLANENEKVVIFIDDKQYYNRFNVRAIAQGMSEDASWFEGWSVADELLGGTNQVAVPYKNEMQAMKITGANPISSSNGFYNMLELDNPSHAAIVYNSGQSSELMFGFHSDGNFYWGTGRSATMPDHYGMYLNANSGDLGIIGKLTSSEVEVKVGGWADFVFQPNYQLQSLDEVERFINTHKHLPNVPSEKEVTENGLSLGQSDAILLQKIEELTLYTISQQKEIEDLKEQNNRLEQQGNDIAELKKQIKAMKN